jgi:hypothetical protein
MEIICGKLSQVVPAAEDQADAELVGVVLTLLPRFEPKVDSPFSVGFGMPRAWLAQALPLVSQRPDLPFREALDRLFMEDYVKAITAGPPIPLDFLTRAAFVIASSGARRTEAAVYIVEMVYEEGLRVLGFPEEVLVRA